ncbi:MAG: D-amino-acid transaminase [Hyphomicrobiaceae bacterium]
MARCIYVNGSYHDYQAASVHAEDRGFQFGDAVYEVMEVKSGQIIDESRHLQRLERSLGELEMAQPMSHAALRLVIRETVRRNRVADGMVYLQVSRGSGPRDFLFSGVQTGPTTVCLARSVEPSTQAAAAEKGIKVITCPEMRWARCDIKTVMLLPASLAKQSAKQAGAQEAWFVDADGYVLEGGSSNAWILTTDNEIVTRPVDDAILRGVTRTTLVDLLAQQGLSFSQRAFTRDDVLNAREAFITSATNLVMPVIEVDGHPIGDGVPGDVVKLLRRTFHEVAEASDLERQPR